MVTACIGGTVWGMAFASLTCREYQQDPGLELTNTASPGFKVVNMIVINDNAMFFYNDWTGILPFDCDGNGRRLPAWVAVLTSPKPIEEYASPHRVFQVFHTYLH